MGSSGLGARGQDRRKASVLTKTELETTPFVKNQTATDFVIPQQVNEIFSGKATKNEYVKKGYLFPKKLAEDLRVFCFKNRKKEIEVVKEAISTFMEDKENNNEEEK